jgi:hypothetical protein
MPRSPFGIYVDRVFDPRASGSRRALLRFGVGSFTELEALEERRLLATLNPSAVISSTPNGSNFNYTIDLPTPRFFLTSRR